MARRTAEQARQTREDLLDAALDVFWEQGVSRPSLTKVAERAGVTRGAIYVHFDNKADLLGALCERYIFPAEVMEEIRAQGSGDPLGTLRTWILRVLEKTSQDPGHHKLMDVLFMKCEAVDGDGVRDRLVQDGKLFRHHERELLDAAVARGQLPADLDLELASTVLGSFMQGLLRYRALFPDTDLGAPADRLADFAIDMLKSEALRPRD